MVYFHKYSDKRVVGEFIETVDVTNDIYNEILKLVLFDNTDENVTLDQNERSLYLRTSKFHYLFHVDETFTIDEIKLESLFEIILFSVGTALCIDDSRFAYTYNAVFRLTSLLKILYCVEAKGKKFLFL